MLSLRRKVALLFIGMIYFTIGAYLPSLSWLRRLSFRTPRILYPASIAEKVFAAMYVKQKHSDDPTLVVITTYHRSGSTLMGEILNNHPDVMYFYEPLVAAQGFRKFDLSPWKAREPSLNKSVILEGVQVIKNMGSCNYTNIDFMNKHYKRLWKTWPKYPSWSRVIARAANCDHNVDSVRRNLCKNKSTLIKLEQLNSLCKAHKVQAIKTVRLHVTDLLPLIDEGFKLKIIYLLRDPRAILASRKAAKWNWKVTQKEQFQHLCRDMLQNWESAMESHISASHLLIIKYEDLVLNMDTKPKEIFDFLGLEYNSTVDFFLNEVAKGNYSDGKVSKLFHRNDGTFKKHPASHIGKWKTVLNKLEKHLITSNSDCLKYIQLVGYDL